MKRWLWLGLVLSVGLLGCLVRLSYGGPALASHPPDLIPQRAPEAALVRVLPPVQTVTVGQRFTVTIEINSLTTPLTAFQFDLNYDANLIRNDDTSPGAFLRVSGRNIVCPDAVAPAAGVLRYACTGVGSGSRPTGSGALAQVSFVALHEGTSPLTLQGIKLAGSSLPPAAIASTAQGGQVIVNPKPPEWRRIYLPLVGKNFHGSLAGSPESEGRLAPLSAGAEEVQP